MLKRIGSGAVCSGAGASAEAETLDGSQSECRSRDTRAEPEYEQHHKDFSKLH